jgi:DNA-binding transcriptional regulator YdaS (Cro superfamily)
MSALDLAIERAGGVSKLASAIGRRPNVVSNWRLRHAVPEDACPDIERVTGVTCELLRDDLPWHRDSDGNIYVRKTN